MTVFQDYPSVTLPQPEFCIERPLAKVRGNYALLTLCISNLLDNAVKFVAPGRNAKVRIWTEQGDSWVQLKFQDDGIGIPGELFGKIFEPFQRGHPQAGYKGSGIGLTIVKKAVERMTGKIWVESELGKGSTFVIELSAAAATNGANEHTVAAGRIFKQKPLDMTQSRPQKTGSRDDHLILQVEDEETDMLLLKRTLKKTNLPNRLSWARDGLEAVEYLEGRGEFHDRSKHPLPGIIVLDLNMPRMNGFDLLGWLNQHPELRDIPRIVLTSSHLNEDVIKACGLGATSYMIKPHDSSGLERIVKIISDYWALNIRPAA
jgi:CheY-like chemotaxis protein